MALAR